MGLAERFGFGVMALAAQLAACFHQDGRDVGTMGIMALQAILGRGLVVHPFDPELTYGGMAFQAKLWLILLENICIGRTVGRMTAGAFPIGQGLVFNRCPLILLPDSLMAAEAQLAFRAAQDMVIIGCMG